MAERLQEMWRPSLLWPRANATVMAAAMAVEDGEGEEAEARAVSGESHQFAIVIDCGSTGSRMFVYRCVLRVCVSCVLP